ncbi:MAG: substrate-binding domain-containing protein, partial [Deltaproteobacteria bacterium]|nr:substrate-binding domain-containing protein [Deltaproteobacteria bacterium]
FNTLHADSIAVFGNLGSMGGLHALRRNLCHIAASHLLQENESEYNFTFAAKELDKIPVVVNFCKRAQGLLVNKGNPKKIKQIADLGKRGIKIANRSLGTGTRLLFDKELSKAGVKGENIDGYHNEVSRHIDMGLEILSGRIDAGPGIRPVASLLDLKFIPIRWERFDLLIAKEQFFDQGIQHFLSILRGQDFMETAEAFQGYDTSLSGEVVFQKQDKNSQDSA